MTEDDEGVASGHVQDNPPPPDMVCVVVLYTLGAAWLILTIVILTIIITRGIPW